MEADSGGGADERDANGLRRFDQGDGATPESECVGHQSRRQRSVGREPIARMAVNCGRREGQQSFRKPPEGPVGIATFPFDKVAIPHILGLRRVESAALEVLKPGDAVRGRRRAVWKGRRVFGEPFPVRPGRQRNAADVVHDGRGYGRLTGLGFVVHEPAEAGFSQSQTAQRRG